LSKYGEISPEKKSEFFSSFFNIENLAKFYPNFFEILAEFTLDKQYFPNFFVEIWRNLARKKLKKTKKTAAV